MLKDNTDDYREIKPRDLSDTVSAFANLYLAAKDEKTQIFCRKELKALVGICSKKMGKMNDRGRVVIG